MTDWPKRRFSCAPDLESAISQYLVDTGWANRWPELARHVLELSEVFNQTQIETPWENESLQAAYLAYFMPMNSARMLAVFSECQRLGFPIAENLVDLGAGAGTGHFSWNLPAPKNWTNSEISRDAIRLYEKLATRMDRTAFGSSTSLPSFKKTTVLASYVLTEISHLPKALSEAESLILIEPSLQAASRKLMQYRDDLIKQGFSVWGPCTHQQACPLLTQSNRDWCHDRIYFQEPSWWPDLTAHLPMRNDTLTFSYLLAARQIPPWQELPHRARVIGDTLFERGKVRQAVCRGPEREFLAWLTRGGEPATIPHGELIELPIETEKKGNELRPKLDLVRIQ